MVQEQAQAFLKNLPHEEQQKRQIAIRYVLTHLRWRWLLALGIAMGVLNGAYYRTVLLNPVIGIFLCILIWFTNRPLVWWYDLFYFGVLLAFTCFAWIISLATCSVLQLAISSYTGCQVVGDFYHLAGMAVFVLISNVTLYAAIYYMRIRLADGSEGWIVPFDVGIR